jgi:hypothetical protein
MSKTRKPRRGGKPQQPNAPKPGDFVWPAWRDQAERTAPTRARSVLAYIAIGERQRDHPPSRRRPASRRERAIEARRDRYVQPDATERVIQEINHRTREGLKRRGPRDGAISGPLEAAAHYATPALLRLFGLDESHAMPFQEWLTYKLGQVATTDLADVEGYLAWREDCRARVAQAQ